MKKKKVLVGGCFDLLHWGHLTFLKKAKKLGNYLVILLESDENTKKLKGTTRPIHTQDQRAAILKALSLVDQVIPLPDNPDYLKFIQKVKPKIIAVTQGEPNLNKIKIQAKKVGAKVTILPQIKTPSTTQIAKLLRIE